MYVNLERFLKSGLVPEDILYLTAIKQNAAGKNVQFLSTYLSDSKIIEYENAGYIKSVNGKKTDSLYFLIRTTDKANKLLAALSFAAEYNEDDEKLVNWLIQTYKNRGGISKNRQETLRRFSWFRKITGLEGNELANLVLCFINDTFVSENGQNFAQEFGEFKSQNPRAQLSQMADNLAWKPESHQDKHYTLEKSPLWNYYQEHQVFVDGQYNKYLEKL